MAPWVTYPDRYLPQFEDRLNSVAGHLAQWPQALIDGSFDYVGLLRDVVDQARCGNDTFPGAERKLLEFHGKAFAVEHLAVGGQLPLQC